MEINSQSILIFITTVIVSTAAIDSSLKNNNKFVFAVIANPQAFYLKSGGEANDEEVNGAEWQKINKNVAKIKSLGISFGTINGDLSETGHKKSFNAIAELYEPKNDSEIPFYVGLGNRDYQDNVGSCKYTNWKGEDGCAMESMLYLENRIFRYLAFDKVVNYTDLPTRINYVDPIGSFSYSWDYDRVHFVQLQNYPTYKVKLMDDDSVRYTVISSLTWLADDLRMARHRHVTDIILNFHQYEGDFQKNSEDDEKKQFRAIMETYKPLAVFTGNETGFIKHSHTNHSFYYHSTVFDTGPAFDGKFHLVGYNNNNSSLTVEEWDTITGTAIKLQTHLEARQPLTPICKLPGNTGSVGEVYASKLIPTSLEWNLVPVLQPENVVQVEQFAELSLSSWKKNVDNQAWGFQKFNGDAEPEYSSWYFIRHKATNFVLEGNSHGSISLNEPTKLTKDPISSFKSLFQQWRPIKISETEMLILNRGGNFFLSIDKSRLRGNAGYEFSNKAKMWQIKHYINQSTLNNIRYFVAKTNNAWMNQFPEGNSSDLHWQYLGSHDYCLVSPCIGW